LEGKPGLELREDGRPLIACMGGNVLRIRIRCAYRIHTYIHAYIPLPVSCRIAVCVFSRLCCDDVDDDDILRFEEAFYCIYRIYQEEIKE
jgi:hypothetical protein